MRRIAFVALALVAAAAAPVRAACGAVCVEPAPVEVEAASPPCHEAPEEDAAPGHCSHDHSASVRPAARASAADTAPIAAAPSVSPSIEAPMAIAAAADTAPAGSTRGSPPSCLLQLRL